MLYLKLILFEFSTLLRAVAQEIFAKAFNFELFLTALSRSKSNKPLMIMEVIFVGGAI